jgi:hypothetical protein
MPNAVEVASALQCDCGCSRFFRFGPYRDDASAWPGNADPGLRWVYTCTSCGEQLRVYQTGPLWRAARRRDTDAPADPDELSPMPSRSST